MFSHLWVHVSIFVWGYTVLLQIKVCKDQELKQSEPKLQPSKPKQEITYITYSQNTKRTYGQPSLLGTLLENKKLLPIPLEFKLDSPK